MIDALTNMHTWEDSGLTWSTGQHSRKHCIDINYPALRQKQNMRTKYADLLGKIFLAVVYIIDSPCICSIFHHVTYAPLSLP